MQHSGAFPHIVLRIARPDSCCALSSLNLSFPAAVHFGLLLLSFSLFLCSSSDSTRSACASLDENGIFTLHPAHLHPSFFALEHVAACFASIFADDERCLSFSLLSSFVSCSSHNSISFISRCLSTILKVLPLPPFHHSHSQTHLFSFSLSLYFLFNSGVHGRLTFCTHLLFVSCVHCRCCLSRVCTVDVVCLFVCC